ncbi:hypothetical protein BO78DRAFT_400430 [Aspergillus sclerotiicarbonarius CBS 121057]|uniref:Uncharacterized protein n=1 Tax=Aspergillus sclerotiicarbonarius (strain CBS 121057 / IBT 28362) TaxID=1448318 RepID=A0A319EP13_ASPSB|nr:hypothetical protein BO78DRAFT_400430 [Aspergillus sclerotiicarbonarius CBS 121057]
MLTRLTNIFTRSTRPSVLLVVGKFGATIHVLHLVPEDGTIERFSLTTPSSTTTFRYRGAIEQAREHIGTVTLHVGDGETANSFLDDVETRIRKLRNDDSLSSQLQTGSVAATQLVQDVLQPAALDAIHEREERDRSMRATQTSPVFVVYIIRSSAGRSLTELTSFP